MESAAKETSPAPSSKGLKSVLTKARRGLKDNSSTLSVNGTDTSSNSHGGLRSSIDSTVEKLKPRTSADTSQNEGDKSGSSGIAKLISSRSRKKRKKARAAAEQDQEEATRGCSIGERASHGASGDLDASDKTPEDDDGGSSLLTYDSDLES